MTSQEIKVVYQWIAKEGNEADLKRIYKEVTAQMQANEPDALEVGCYYDETNNTLVVYDHFKDAAALGLHLGTTAAGHFGSLNEVAEAGPFLFCGNVPSEMQQAALNMGLKASFAPQLSGFKRV